MPTFLSVHLPAGGSYQAAGIPYQRPPDWSTNHTAYLQQWADTTRRPVVGWQDNNDGSLTVFFVWK